MTTIPAKPEGDWVWLYGTWVRADAVAPEHAYRALPEPPAEYAETSRPGPDPARVTFMIGWSRDV